MGLIQHINLPLKIDYEKNSLSDEEQKLLDRAAVDFIAGMMDDYAKAMYKRYYNVDFDSIPINDN